MYVTIARFVVPSNTDLEELRHSVVHEAFEIAQKASGLRSTTLMITRDRRELVAHHVWDDPDRARAFLRSDVWATVVATYGEPRLEHADICAYIEEGDVVFPSGFEDRLLAGGEAPARRPEA